MLKLLYKMRPLKRSSNIAVAFISCCTLTVIFRTAILTTISEVSHSSLLRLRRFVQKEIHKESALFERRGKVVILYSNQRSGSTFVGEFFNQNPNAFYLFEPLFSYTPSCKILYEERLKTLRNQCMCDFRTVADDYHHAHSVNSYGDQAGKCLIENICFIDNHVHLLKNYESVCFAQKARTISDLSPNTVWDIINKPGPRPSDEADCGIPLNMTLVSALCSASPLVAYKVLRVCDLSKLESVYREITAEGNDVYVVHLVRDPRAIVNSALGTELQFERIDTKATVLCSRLGRNLKYIEEMQTAKTSASQIISDGRYMRIRHEDISLDPVEGARQIYSFIGLPLPPTVKDWIEESSINPMKKIAELMIKRNSPEISKIEKEILDKKIEELNVARHDPYGTVRISAEVVSKWRKKLPIEVVNKVQAHCAEVIEQLGYKIIHNENELLDLDNKLF